jgi:hypothetical protein
MLAVLEKPAFIDVHLFRREKEEKEILLQLPPQKRETRSVQLMLRPPAESCTSLSPKFARECKIRTETTSSLGSLRQGCFLITPQCPYGANGVRDSDI